MVSKSRRLACPRCGRVRQVNDSVDNKPCLDCRDADARASQHKDVAFNGTWKRRGLIYIPVAAPEPEPDMGPGCIDCGTPIDPRATRCRPCNGIAHRGQVKSTVHAPIWQTIADNLAATTNPPLGTCCDDCGCLLVGPDETCPGCLVTAGVDAQEVA